MMEKRPLSFSWSAGRSEDDFTPTGSYMGAVGESLYVVQVMPVGCTL